MEIEQPIGYTLDQKESTLIQRHDVESMLIQF